MGSHWPNLNPSIHAGFKPVVTQPCVTTSVSTPWPNENAFPQINWCFAYLHLIWHPLNASAPPYSCRRRLEKHMFSTSLAKRGCWPQSRVKVACTSPMSQQRALSCEMRMVTPWKRARCTALFSSTSKPSRTERSPRHWQASTLAVELLLSHRLCFGVNQASCVPDDSGESKK